MAKESAGTGNGKRKRCCRGWWWKLPLTFLLLLVVAAVIVYLRLGSIATSVANSQLPKILNTEASVERIEVRLRHGLAEVHGLHIGQPDGFGDGALVELDRVMAEVDLGSLGGGDLITIRAIELDGLKAHIVRNEDGVLNVTRLGPPPSDTPAEPATVSEAQTASAESGAEEEKDSFPGIRIDIVAIQDVALNFTDQSAGGRPIEIALGELGIDITGCEVRLGDDVAATLQDGRVTLKDISVSQPAGFGDDALIHVPLIQLDIGSQLFEANVVRLRRLAVEGLRAHVIRGTNGVMNVTQLAGGSDATEGLEVAPEVTESTDAVAIAPPAEAAPGAGSPIGVYLGELALTDFQVVYADGSLAAEPMEFTIQDLGLSIRDFMAFVPEPTAPSSSIELNMALDQGSYSPALLGLVASLGPISAGVPDLNAQIVLSGFVLDTIDPLIPPGVRETVGANGADIHASVALNAQTIDLEGRVETDADHSYPIHVTGLLAEPEVDLGPIAMAVAGRLTGGIQNLTEGAAVAAVDLAQGATSAATDLGEGAADVVGKVGGGLFGAAKAALSLDLKGMGSEVKDTVTGVASEATETVGSTAGSVTDEMKQSVSTVKGGKRTAKWLEGVSSRHDDAVTAAAQALQAMPFPPPVVDAPAKGK